MATYLEVDIISFGIVVDAAKGHAVGPRGLTVTRTSRVLDDPILVHCLPTGLIGSGDYLLDRLDAACQADGRGAFLVYPVWAGKPVRPAPAYVVACRVGLHRCRTPRGPRFFPIVNSVLIPASFYVAHAAVLIPLLARQIDLAPVTNALPAEMRLSAPRLRLTIEAATSKPVDDERTDALRLALRRGSPTRFGQETFSGETQFLETMAGAVGGLRKKERAAIAFAVGYSRHTTAFQIVYLPSQSFCSSRQSAVHGTPNTPRPAGTQGFRLHLVGHDVRRRSSQAARDACRTMGALQPAQISAAGAYRARRPGGNTSLGANSRTRGQGPLASSLRGRGRARKSEPCGALGPWRCRRGCRHRR